MTIREVSGKYGIPSATLRYYESEGLIPHIARKNGGVRDYSESDCSWIELVSCMRKAGLTIEAIAEYRRLYEEGESTVSDRIALLKSEREKLFCRLEDTKAMLSHLDYKISRYEEYLKTGKLEW